LMGKQAHHLGAVVAVAGLVNIAATHKAVLNKRAHHLGAVVAGVGLSGIACLGFRS
jgi:hypothetical protein